MQLPDERLDLLIDCLAVAPDAAHTTVLRMALLAEQGALAAMVTAAARRQLLSRVLDAFQRHGILPLPPAGAPEPLADRTPMQALAAARDDFAARRAALAGGFRDIVAALNERGIAPLVVKGAVSLWTGDPAWRYQRDIDFRVDAHEVEPAMRALGAIGFEPVEGLVPSAHHLQPLFRPGVPGVIEVHTSLCGRRAEAVLTDAELVAGAREDTRDGMTVRLLRPGHAALHGIVHHHIQNFGAVWGTMSLKGLCEYAHALGAMGDADAGHLARTTATSPRLRATVDLWTAAAWTLLGLDPPAALRPPRHAVARSDRLRGRLLGPRRAGIAAALVDEIAAGVRVAGSPARALTAAWAPLVQSAQVLYWGDHPRRAVNAAGIIDDVPSGG